MSDNYNFNFTPIIESWGGELQKHTDYNSWTERREVLAGDGQTPPTIVIPLDRRSHPSVSKYCYGPNAETKGVYQVVDSGNAIPAQNVNPSIRFEIGKPPGSKLWHVMGQSESGLAQTGGIEVKEIRTQQEHQITPDRVQEIRLSSNGSLQPDFIGGKVRLPDGEKRDIPSGTGPDLTSYVPATPNKEVWVTVGINPTTFAFDVAAGSELDIGTSSYEADAPDSVGAGYEPFQSYKLTYDDTETKDAPGFMMLYSGVPTYGATSGGGSGTGDVLGPASATDGALALFDGTTGKLLQDSTATLPLSVEHGGTGADLSAEPNGFLYNDSGTITAETLVSADIPNLDANKITSGTLDVARIPDLNASKITAGTLDVGRIPDLNASKITAGTLDVARIPDLAASKIVSGLLALARGGTGADLSATGAGFLKQASTGANVTVAALVSGDIPNLDAAKITSGVLDFARIPATATRAIKGATQAITGGVDTLITFSGTNYDDGTWFDNANDRIVIPANGRYHIIGYFNTSAAANATARVLRGATVLSRGWVNELAINLVWEGDLTASDAITLRATTVAGSTATTDCYLLVRRLS